MLPFLGPLVNLNFLASLRVAVRGEDLPFVGEAGSFVSGKLLE